LDTIIFIYQLEAHSRYLALTDPVFAWMERPNSRAVTSTITMAELLAQPYRNGNDELSFMACCPQIRTWSGWPDPRNCRRGVAPARLYRLRTPDALQAATATHALATGLVTNDSVFERVDGFETLVLDRIH
jgi:predicted nucleic acid-binding protein